MIEADYVIVGAGSAGCVLANQITQSGRYSVILLEAGPADWHPWIHVPLGYGKLFADPRYNWMFASEPEPELNERRIAQPRGRVLGGSSSINGLLYVRGQKGDFDRWELAGLREWGWDKVLPAFRKAEDQERGADAWHGRGGPLAVSDQRTTTSLCDSFIEACKQAGLPQNEDFNGETQEGAGYYQVTARRGRRWSAARGYLRSARGRANLRVLTGAAATRILFDGQAATGVRFRKDGAEVVAKAGREVLVCAGAFASPQLLQVSGVGPGELLRDRLNVPIVTELPAVGRHLQDHLQVRLVQRATRKVTVNDVVGSPIRSVAAALQWTLFGRGPLTYSAGVAGAFFRTCVSPGDTPDVQSLFIPFSTDKMGTGLHPFSGFTSSVCQLRPASVGTVSAQSADMGTPPLIQPHYLSAEEDRRCIVAGAKELRRILRQPALRPWIAAEVEPPPEMASDEEFLDYIRATAGSIYHPTSTVRMGGPDERAAALDGRFRVRGCGRLRVIDASAMPWVPSGNTNAAVIMLAERGGDFVLEDAER